MSILVSLLAALSVCVMKLHKKTVYRLALYQSLSSLLFSAQFAAQFVFIDCDRMMLDADKCTLFAFLDLYSGWTKLIFTACVTFHLFCFAVLHKNYRRLEPLYVVFSLIIPAVIASVPLALRGYGPAGFSCWIEERRNNGSLIRDGVIETFALWYGPSTIILIFTSLAMIVLVIALVRRAYFRRPLMRYQNGKALKQLLPLAAFPILFSIPPLLNHIYSVMDSSSDAQIISPLDAACVIGWSLLTGVSVIVHVAATGLYAKASRWCQWCVNHPHMEEGYGTINDKQFN